MKILNAIRLLGSGGIILGLGGCLGPNPLFFAGTSAANAAISTVVGTLVRDLLNLGS